MVAELEQVEPPLCRVHQKAEIEERERAKVRQSLDGAHTALRELRDEAEQAEAEQAAATAPPEPVDPLEAALANKVTPGIGLNATAAEVVRHIGYGQPADNDPDRPLDAA